MNEISFSDKGKLKKDSEAYYLEMVRDKTKKMLYVLTFLGILNTIINIVNGEPKRITLPIFIITMIICIGSLLTINIRKLQVISMYASTFGIAIIISFMTHIDQTTIDLFYIFILPLFAISYHSKKNNIFATCLMLSMTIAFYFFYNDTVFKPFPEIQTLFFLLFIQIVVGVSTISQAHFSEKMIKQSFLEQKEAEYNSYHSIVSLKKLEETFLALSEFANQLQLNAQQTNIATSSIYESFEEMDLAVQEQSRSLNNLSEDTENIKSEVITNLVYSSFELKKNTSNSSKIMDETKTKIRDLILQTEHLHFTYQKNLESSNILYEKIEEIKKIIFFINHLSDKTNTLSINATIEASKTDREGNGFEVLSLEIRKLAEKSLEATLEIQYALNSVFEEVELNKQKLERSKQSIEDTIVNVKEVGEAYGLIYSKNELNTREIQNIDHKIKYLEKSYEEINIHTGNMSSISQQNTATISNLKDEFSLVQQKIDDISQQFMGLQKNINKTKE